MYTIHVCLWFGQEACLSEPIPWDGDDEPSMQECALAMLPIVKSIVFDKRKRPDRVFIVKTNVEGGEPKVQPATDILNAFSLN
jgi:hypothetical protein